VRPTSKVARRARLLHPYRRWRFAEFGNGSFIHKPDWVLRPKQIAIGSNVMILHGAWLSVERPGPDPSEPVIRIGDGTSLRSYVTVSATESIVIEDHCAIGSFTALIDSQHTYEGDSPNPVWNPMRTAPIRVGRGTWIGERVGVMAGARIGKFCIIGANAVVTGEIPDFSIAVGVPARVIGSTREQAEHLDVS
jgi:acetyltransferase-like isoleucine patch superfamily enzyme